MRSFSLADMHCDTAFEIFRRGESFEHNHLSVSADKADVYSNYLQIMAIWSDKAYDNNTAYHHTLKVIDYLKKTRRSGRNVIFSTHSSEEAETFADHIIKF